MHHQGRTVAPMFDRAAYGPDGLVEAVEVRDGSFIMGVQWHPNSLRARGKWGVFSLACAGSIRFTYCDGRCAWALPSQYRRLPDARSWPTMEYADGI